MGLTYPLHHSPRSTTCSTVPTLAAFGLFLATALLAFSMQAGRYAPRIVPSPFQRAVEKGDLPTVRRLLDAGEPPQLPHLRGPDRPWPRRHARPLARRRAPPRPRRRPRRPRLRYPARPRHGPERRLERLRLAPRPRRQARPGGRSAGADAETCSRDSGACARPLAPRRRTERAPLRRGFTGRRVGGALVAPSRGRRRRLGPGQTLVSGSSASIPVRARSAAKTRLPAAHGAQLRERRVRSGGEGGAPEGQGERLGVVRLRDLKGHVERAACEGRARPRAPGFPRGSSGSWRGVRSPHWWPGASPPALGRR